MCFKSNAIWKQNRSQLLFNVRAILEFLWIFVNVGTVILSQGVELQMKVDGLQQELAQSYRAHAQAREQLVTQLTASQNFHAQLAEKEALIAELQGELVALRWNSFQSDKTSQWMLVSLVAVECVAIYCHPFEGKISITCVLSER